MNRVSLLWLVVVSLGCQPGTPLVSSSELDAGLSDAGSADAGAPEPSTRLAGLAVSAGALSPAFDPSTAMYVVSLAASVAVVTVTPTAEAAGATIQLNGSVLASGSASPPIPLVGGTARVVVRVTNSLGSSTTYAIVFVGAAAALTQQAFVRGSNTEPDDYFGVSLALDGDTLVVGAYMEYGAGSGINPDPLDNSAEGAGAVYVFVRSGTAWTQQAYLKPFHTYPALHFGYAVAVSGDTVAVGSQWEDSAATGVNGNQFDASAPGSGSVHIFVRKAGVWSQQAYVKASNTGAYDEFGDAVALSGDTLVVGAPSEDSAATGVNGNQADNSALHSGAVYVFTRSGTVWTQQAYVKASNPSSGGLFGVTVALSNDTLAVGAICEASNAKGVGGNQLDHSMYRSGAVYVFVRTAGAWTQQAYLKASNTEANDNFGDALALSGDTLAVTARNEASAATGINGDQANNSAKDSGAVYVFVRSGTAWSQQAYLKASNSEAGDSFGSGLALTNDLLVVGAPGEDSAATGLDGNQADNSAKDSGATYLFSRSGGVWTQQSYLKPSNSAPNRYFGTNVALTAETLAVIAFGSGPTPGDAYLFGL